LSFVAILLPHASKVLFLALSVTFFVFLFVTQISLERMNGFAPNSQGKRVWSLARATLNNKVKAKHQGQEGQKTRYPLLSPPGNDSMKRARCK